MKPLLLLFTTVTLTLTSNGINIPNVLIGNDIFEEMLTFDGFEGDYFFFTNTANKSIVLEMDEHTSFGNKVLTENDEVKNVFKVTYKLIRNTKDISSSGILIKVLPED